MIEFLMLCDPASQDRLEIGEVDDVNDVIDTVGECAHGIVGGKGMAEQDHEMLAPLRARFLDHFAQNRIRLQGGTFEVFVDDDQIVVVGPELEDHVFFEQTEMHFVGHIDELRDDDLLLLLLIDTNQRCVVADVNKSGICLLVHGGR
jgi:hypothetical protein